MLDPERMPELRDQGRPRHRHLQRRHAAGRRRQGRRRRDHGRRRVPRRPPRAPAARRCGSASRPTRRSARARRCSTSSASAPRARTRSTAPSARRAAGRDVQRRRGDVTIEGVDVHPGFATGKLVNAARLAGAVLAALPGRPHARGDRGPRGLHPPVRARAATPGTRDDPRRSCATSTTTSSSEHVELLRRTAEEVVAPSRGRGSSVDVLDAVPEHAPLPRRAPGGRRRGRGGAPARRAIEPLREPIRGGTDGSRLSATGLPTPNLFTGGHEFHCVREWASVQDMAAAAAVVVRLAGVWAERARGRWPGGARRPS